MSDVLNENSPDTGVLWLMGHHFYESDQPDSTESGWAGTEADLVAHLLRQRRVDGGPIYSTFFPAVTQIDNRAHRADAYLNAIAQQRSFYERQRRAFNDSLRLSLGDYAAPVRTALIASLEAIISSGSIAAIAALGLGTSAAVAAAGAGGALTVAGAGAGAALGSVGAGATQAMALAAKAALDASFPGSARRRAIPGDSVEMKRYLKSVSQRINAASVEPEDAISPDATQQALNALAGAADPSSVLPSVTSDGEGGCALFWSVDRNTLEIEFGEDGSFYLRMKLADGSVVEEVEGDQGDSFPEEALRRCLRELSDAVFASKFASAVG